MRFFLRVAGNAFAIWIVTLIPVLRVNVIAFQPAEVPQFILTLLAVGAIFAVVNGVLGVIIKVVAFPLYIITLGLISLIINGALLQFTAWLTHWWSWGLRVESFWWGVVAALLITIINAILGTGRRRRRRERRW
jgi:putative membrane protein